MEKSYLDYLTPKRTSAHDYYKHPPSSSQVKLLITKNAFCIVQRATKQSKTGIFRNFGVAEAPPGFQAGWSDCMYFFSLFLFILFAHLNFP
jgi:hypothetical protein